MSHSDTGERVTPVLDFPSRDGLVVQAIRVDYEPGGFTRGTHRHPAGAIRHDLLVADYRVVRDGVPYPPTRSRLANASRLAPTPRPPTATPTRGARRQGQPRLCG